MEELIGNTDGFAESGLVQLCPCILQVLTVGLSVSSAIVQRYLPQILEAALNRYPQIQAAALDILSYTVKQGLAHPLQVSFCGHQS